MGLAMPVRNSGVWLGHRVRLQIRRTALFARGLVGIALFLSGASTSVSSDPHVSREGGKPLVCVIALVDRVARDRGVLQCVPFLAGPLCSC